MQTPERSDQIKQLFCEALDREANEQALFLAESCPDDPALREEVESLLAAYNRSEGFLGSPAVELFAPEIAERALKSHASADLVGKQIGSYRVIREIARGGMGAVFLAERDDAQFRRQVAIKVTKRGMDTDGILRRFLAERQILASLDHPNIARLLDGGTTEDGLPYLVMEYVDGQPIDRYCDDLNLSIDERLALFRIVCSAVHYAHQNLIVHRDIKPGNILVTADGVPKLLDFGIAKLLQSDSRALVSVATATAMRVMTPEYASPEQVRGESLTAASDIYSLGIVLCEMLTGHRPYKLNSRSPEEVSKIICEQEPERPSRVASRLEGSSGTARPGGIIDAPESLSKRREGEPQKLRRRLQGDIDNIVLMAIRKEPGLRYRSAEKLSEDIRLHLAGLSITARKHTLAYRSIKYFKRNRRPVISTIAVAVVCLILGAFFMRSATRSNNSVSMAVLPFNNISSDENLDYLSDGITDNLIDAFSRVHGVAVLARNSVFRYKGQAIDARSLADRLGVEAVLTGSFASDRDSISIEVALFETRKNQTTWHQQYDGKTWDIQAIQQEIVQDLSRKLDVREAAEEGMRSREGGTQDSEAYRLYLRGTHFWNQRSYSGLNKGIAYFEDAIAKDPNYALAYCGLANSYSLLGAYQALPPHESFARGKVAAMKALEIDPNLAEGHTALALITWLYDWDWASADREFRQAIELSQTYPTAPHWYGLYLGEMGRFDEAIAAEKRALVLDPFSVPIYADLGRVYYYARRYDESLAQYRKAIALNPEWGAFYAELAPLYEQKGMAEEMVKVNYEREHDLELKRAFYAGGINGYWRKALALDKLHHRFNGYYDQAEVYARLGQSDEAVTQLRKAYEARDHRITQSKVNPLFDSLRSKPAFVELMRVMNLSD